MDHKKAADILINMLAKQGLNLEEKKALTIAIGVLAWTGLAKSRIKAIKAKRAKDAEQKKYLFK